jgi:hypothetical protein
MALEMIRRATGVGRKEKKPEDTFWLFFFTPEKCGKSFTPVARRNAARHSEGSNLASPLPYAHLNS